MRTDNYTPPDKPVQALPLDVESCRTAWVRALAKGRVDVRHFDDIGQAERDRLTALGLTTACWLWTGAITSNGYGKVTVAGQARRAHRVALVAKTGQDVPAGHQLDHLCRNRTCVNPGHLEPVTNRENTLRGDSPGAVTRRTGICARGHRLTGLNVTMPPSRAARGWTQCRACANATTAASHRRRRGWDPTELEYDAFVRDYAADRYDAYTAGIDLVDPGVDPDGQLRWTW